MADSESCSQVDHSAGRSVSDDVRNRFDIIFRRLGGVVTARTAVRNRSAGRRLARGFQNVLPIARMRPWWARGLHDGFSIDLDNQAATPRLDKPKCSYGYDQLGVRWQYR